MNKIIYEKFHDNAKRQQKIITKNNFTYKIILEILNKYLKSNQKILDIGSGVGTLSFYCGQNGNMVLGIDISENAIDTAKQSAKNLKLTNVKFKVLNFPKDVPQDKYDLIIFSEVIEHLQDDTLALKKIYKLLKPNGTLILSTPSINAPMYKLGLANEFDKRVGHLRRYDLNELSSKCKNLGFKIVEIKRTEGLLRNFLFLNPIAGNLVRFIKFFFIDIVTSLDNVSLNLFGESQIFIVLTK